jgi:hypothetical protein
MQETILDIIQGTFPKKYTALLKDKRSGKVRRVPFGDQRYEQYKDRTKRAIYANANHGDRKRLRNYYSRHSGVKTRAAGIKKERAKAEREGRYTAKLLSHLYLW